MKKIVSISMGLLAILAISCSKKDTPIAKPAASEVPKGETITITVGAPEDIESKVAYTYDEAEKKLKLTWEEGDMIVLQQGGNAYPFTATTISENGKMATFTGTATGKGTYDVFYAGNGETAMTLAEVEAMDYTTQTQSENNSSAHLKFAARLNSVTFTPGTDDIYFTADWAKDHGNGTYQQSGAIRIRLQNPGVTSLKSVTLTAPSAIFPKTNAPLSETSRSLSVSLPNVNIAAADPIVVYAMLPWSKDGVALPAGDYTVSVTTEDYDVWTKTKAFEANTLSPIAVNSIGLNKTGFALQQFYGGSGVEGDPYLIANARQLQNVNEAMSPGKTTFFRLISDIDMTGKKWAELNSSKDSDYSAEIDFDGNGKTVSHLCCNMFYVFKGSAKDLTLALGQDEEVTNRGIFAEFCQGAGHSISNVNITGGSVKSESPNVGALIGNINSGTSTDVTSVTISNCTVSNTNVTGAGTVGGLIGVIDSKTTKAIINGCSYTGGTVTSSSKYVGGLIGSTGGTDAVAKTTVTDCHVENTTVEASNAGDDARAGGFVGQLGKGCYIQGSTVGASDQKVTVKVGTPTENGKVMNSGGFVGVCYGKITRNEDERNTAYAKITSTNPLSNSAWRLNVGGFGGYVSGTIEYSDAYVDIDLNGRYIGGFIGFSLGDSNINHCTVSGSVKATGYTGGFIGWHNAGEVSDNMASGSVTSQNSTGGFIGACAGGTVSNNITSMAVSGTAFTGGFVGYCTGGSFTGIRANSNAQSTCKASGDVNGSYGVGGFVGRNNSSATFDCCDALGTVTGSGYGVGGFVGSSTGDGSYSHCRYWGTSVESTISSGDARVGGFCGSTMDADGNYMPFTGSFSKCWVSQGGQGLTVKSTKNMPRVGGFIGSLGTNVAADNTGMIEKCRVHKATVNGGQYTGGFAGVSYGDISQCCVTAGSVTATGASVGGFAGYQQYNTIRNCYTTTNVSSSKSNIGGMVGNIKKGTTVEYCYVGSITIGGEGSYQGSFIGIGESGATQNKCIAWVEKGWQGSGTESFTECHRKKGNDSYISTWATTYGWDTDIWNIPSNSNSVSLKETETIMDL